ncbi:MAG: Dabb family protein [Lachnospiraceae bacterium]|nr:Dabb family protein [Lachnospiraceae bacterium]
MVKHIILWKLKEGCSKEEADAIKAGIKTGLEALVGVVPGLIEVKVTIDALPSSNADILLDSTCADEEALKLYASHPAHVKVKDEAIVPFVSQRSCIDFVI